MIFEGMKDKQLLELKDKIKKVKHVNKVIWYDDVVDVNMPREFLSKKTYKMFNSGNSTVMAAFLDTDISDVGTTHAIKEIKSITRHPSFFAQPPAANWEHSISEPRVLRASTISTQAPSERKCRLLCK